MVARQLDSFHLLLHIPEDWTNDQKGDFFETFVSELLRPMRYSVTQRIRFTGMEIDLLAKSMDEPRTVFVECKAQRDTLPADVITKLVGQVTLRKADSGWLFATSDLGKEARGAWEEIKADAENARRFTWYSPSKIVEVLITQKGVRDPNELLAKFDEQAVGDATLVCSPRAKHWLFEILEDGMPTFFTVFDAVKGEMLSEAEGAAVAQVSDRFKSLKYKSFRAGSALPKPLPVRAPVARVVSGDAWDDLRPSRPIDFVGRDDVIQDILNFVNSVREGNTTTRTFAVQGPSGWGKSSLVLKLGDLASKGRRIANCSFTGIDSRSATNSAFVSSAIRTAFCDAVKAGLLPNKVPFNITSLTHPLDSPDINEAATHLSASGSVLVLVFDQFEELFTKEPLFETFTAIRELSLDLDSKQFPLVLGFAWKTDISLPQEHPAYYLWHELTDRRKDFKIRQFGSGDIARVISKAAREVGMKFNPALRGRLVEQCQGYPWLLKKLLVHVTKRLEDAESQYALLERELDVEMLFKEDLAGLSKVQVQCLKFIAQRAPVAVTEVEDHFTADNTNLLLSKRLLVRSGLNYVVYWDIFRDYLIDGRVPHIPWSRTFQRDAGTAVEAVQAIKREPKIASARLSEVLGGTVRGVVNVLSDLVALQLVERVADDSYVLGSHVKGTTPKEIAEHVHGQFSRHMVCRELARYERDIPIPPEDLDTIVRRMKPPETELTDNVVHQYAMNLRRWLLFAGHLEERGNHLFRPYSKGAQMGIVSAQRTKRKQFMGCGTTEGLLKLLQMVFRKKEGIAERELLKNGLRNALYDAIALGLVGKADEGRVILLTAFPNLRMAEVAAKKAVLQQPVIHVIKNALADDSEVTNMALGEALQKALKTQWKPASALRYANGLRGYYYWARS